MDGREIGLHTAHPTPRNSLLQRGAPVVGIKVEGGEGWVDESGGRHVDKWVKHGLLIDRREGSLNHPPTHPHII